MSVTTAIVKKLILEYIGGTKLKGNDSKTYIKNKLVAVKLPKKSSNKSLSEMKAEILKNPIAKELGDLENFISDSLDLVTSLDAGIQSTLTPIMTTLSTAKNVIENHSNILSGLIDSDDIMSFSQLSNLTDVDESLISSVVDKEYLNVDTLSKIRELSSLTDSLEISNKIQEISDLVDNFNNIVNSKISNDVGAQNLLIENLYVSDLINSVEAVKGTVAEIFIK